MLLSKLRYKQGRCIIKQRIEIQCDMCNIQFSLLYSSFKSNLEKYGADYCRSCRQRIQYKNGTRISFFTEYNKSNNGKTLEERLGQEKANLLKSKMSIANSGSNNPNYGGKYSTGKEMVLANAQYKGKTYEERYGEEKAILVKQKLSEKMSGENNPMHGKPAPVGSGNGWSGWYHDTYFRSLLELSYMKYLRDNNISYINGETLSIPYVINNKSRNYYPDFIIDNKIIEIKPYKLINSNINKCKFEAAKKLYKDNFIVLTEYDIIVLNFDEINTMVNEGTIVFIDRYKAKFEKWRANRSE